MKTISNSARETILRKLDSKHNRHFPNVHYESIRSNAEYFVQPDAHSLITTFCSVFTNISGSCVVCDSEKEALQYIASILNGYTAYSIEPKISQICKAEGIAVASDENFAKTAKFAITSCDALIARTASVLVNSQTLNGRKSIAAPETHIVLAYETQMYADLPDTFAHISYETIPSQITVITGPSRTADIEKTLVLGAHGPKNLVVVIIKNV